MLALIAAVLVAIYAIHNGLQWFDLVWFGVALFMAHFAIDVGLPRRRA
jgi:hypothetical protein